MILGTGIPKPTAAVKGTSKTIPTSEPEGANLAWYPQNGSSKPNKMFNNNGIRRNKQDQVAMVSPTPNFIPGEEIVKQSQKSIKHSAEALVEVAANPPPLNNNNNCRREATPPTQKGLPMESEDSEDLALLNVKPMEPLKRSSPYKYSTSGTNNNNGKHQQQHRGYPPKSTHHFNNPYGNLNGQPREGTRYVLPNHYSTHNGTSNTKPIISCLLPFACIHNTFRKPNLN